MSAQALQRVLVRMLYDPRFVEQVYAEPAQALHGLELSEPEQSWLRQPDRRAFAVDPYRRGRSLQGLVEEYPVSCALAFANQLTWEELDTFFASPGFHTAVQDGRSLALAFGDHLLELSEQNFAREAWLPPLARLERGLSRVRRRIPRGQGNDGVWRLSPHVEVLAAPRGTLAAHQMVSGRLGDPAELRFEGLLDSALLRDLQLPPPGDGDEHLLLILGEDDQVRIEPLTPELFAILEGARDGASHAELVTLCLALGADEDQTEEILGDFARSGELRPPKESSV